MQKRSRRNYNVRNYPMHMDQRSIYQGFHPYNYNIQPSARGASNRFPSMGRRPMMYDMQRPIMRMPQNFIQNPMFDQNMVGGPIPFALNNPAKFVGMPMISPNFLNMMPMNPQMGGGPLNMQIPINNMPLQNIQGPQVMPQSIPIPPPQADINPENYGEEIYNRIAGLCSSENQRGKVTGMLLELDLQIQQEMLTNDKKLHQLVEEAKVLLESKT